MLRLHPLEALRRLQLEPPEIVLTAPDRAEDRIDAYLRKVEARLMGFPPDIRQGIREELRQHIGALVVAHGELGVDEDEATIAALRQFGEAETVARRFRRAWSATAPYEKPWLATWEALKTFGAALSAFVALVALSRVLAMFCPSVFRNWLSLPVGALYVGGLFCLPIACGIRLAKRVPTRAGMGAFFALAGLTVVAAGLTSAIEGGLCYNMNEFLTFCVVLWIPTGCLSATATNFVNTRRLRRKLAR